MGRAQKLELLKTKHCAAGARLSNIAEKCVSQIGSWTQEVGFRGPDEACALGCFFSHVVSHKC